MQPSRSASLVHYSVILAGLCESHISIFDLYSNCVPPLREPIARAANCSVVRQYTGHGINDLFHTSPNIPHYSKNRAIGTMKAGMCFTIEPVRVKPIMK